MASRKVEVAIVGDAKSLERAFSRAGKSAGQFGNQMSGFHKAGQALAKGFAVAAVGITAIAAVGAEQLSQQAKVTAQTNTVLKNLGSQAGVTTAQVERLASAIQAQTGAEDDNVQAASNVILRYGLITGHGKAAQAQLSRLTRTALDLSVATGKDLTASTQALGRALADPTKAAGALRRAGIVLTAQQKEQIKAMVDSGHTAEAQARVLQLVEGRVKGSAVAFGNTLPGQVEKAKRAFEDLSQNAIATLAPAFSKLVPVLVSALKGIAPLVATAASAIADLANQLMSSPAFQEFARTLKDIATQGIQILVKALQVLAPIVVAVAVPIAALASGLLSSRVAMTALTAAVAAFIALRVTARVTEMVSAFRTFATVSAAATPLRTMAQSLSMLTTGFSGVSAKAVGLAPGLTAAQAGLSRVQTAGTLAKTAMSQFGGSLLSAVGGPVGATIATVTILATIIGSDLVASFARSKDPAARYAEAMQSVATAAGNAKDALSGLAQAMLDVGTSQDRTRETTARVIQIEGELAAMRASGQAGTDAYKAKERELAQAKRENAQATLDVTRNEDALKTKQGEVRTAVGNLAQGLIGATAGFAAQNGAMLQSVAAGRMSRDSYLQWLAAANQKIMGSQELQTFRAQVHNVAGAIRAQGTPQALALADALDKAGKTRDPAALAGFLGKIVSLTGGTKGDVAKLIKDMNAAFGNVGNTKTSGTWLGDLAAKIADAEAKAQAAKRKISGIFWGGSSSNERRSFEEIGPRSFAGPNAESWFYGMRSQAAGAVSGMSALARQRFMATDPEAKRLTDRQKARAKDYQDLQKKQLQQAIDDAQTADEKKRAELDLQAFMDDIEQQGVDDRAQKYQDDIDNLGRQFGRGEIDAQTFQDRLTALLGGDPGSSMGDAFGSQWRDAFTAIMDPTLAIIRQQMGSLTGAQPVGMPATDESLASDAVDQADAWVREARRLNRVTKTMKPRQAQRAWEDFIAKHGENSAVAHGFATGGIVTGPINAIVGEAGPEAIIPLESGRARKMLQGAGANRGGISLTFNGVLDAKDAARKLRPELDRLVRLAV